jgi:hypothetical protein
MFGFTEAFRAITEQSQLSKYYSHISSFRKNNSSSSTTSRRDDESESDNISSIATRETAAKKTSPPVASSDLNTSSFISVAKAAEDRFGRIKKRKSNNNKAQPGSFGRAPAHTTTATTTTKTTSASDLKPATISTALPPHASVHPSFDKPYFHEIPNSSDETISTSPKCVPSSTTNSSTTWSRYLTLKAIEVVEIFCVLLWSFLLFFFIGILPTVLVTFSVLQIWPLELTVTAIFVYILWISTIDKNSHKRGGWGIVGVGKWFYEFKFWDFFRSYFSARLVKTADLPNDRNYIFMNHPHGVKCSHGSLFLSIFPFENPK